MKNKNLYGTAVLLSTLSLGLAGCNGRDPNLRAPIVDASAAATDPANANLLPTQVAGVSYAAQPQSSATGYAPAAYAQTQAAPQSTRNTRNEAYNYNTQQPAYVDQQGNQQPAYTDQQPAYDPNYAPQGNYDQQAANAAEYDEYDSLLDPNVPVAQQAPPPLPADYEQPPAPADDYLWTPGYWDYANAGYYYVPGVWVAPPFIGALWTPGWWGGYGGGYRWHHGYWGRHIGFYGGVNYGFGYIGYGYQGGYWNNNHFWYNRAVNRFGGGYQPRYVYDRRVEVVNNTYINNTRISYYGGNGGLRRAPAPQEFAAVRENRIPPMQTQVMHREQAMQNRAQFFNQNHGRPAMIATSQPLPAQRGIAAPPVGFNNNRQGFENRMGANGFNGMTPQQRQQFQNMNPQQRQAFEQQRQQQMQNMNPQQRQQFEQQRQQQQTLQNQQRVQADQQRVQLQQQQQHNAQQQIQNQQRQQQEQERNQQQQRMQVEQQRNQQQLQNQQRQQQDQQRAQQQQQMQQREQQQEQQRNQQVQNQQRQQQDQQRAQQQQQMQQQRVQQQEQQRAQQQQVQNQQRQQQEQQRAQQQQQMQQQRAQQQEQQRNQQQQMQNQMRQQQEQQRAQQQQQMRQQMQQQHAAPQMQMHSAPPPAPHEGGGEHRR